MNLDQAQGRFVLAELVVFHLAAGSLEIGANQVELCLNSEADTSPHWRQTALEKRPHRRFMASTLRPRIALGSSEVGNRPYGLKKGLPEDFYYVE